MFLQRKLLSIHISQKHMTFLTGLVFSAGKALTPEDVKPLTDFQQRIEAQRREHRAKVELELQLIRDVLKIDTTTTRTDC